VADRIGQAASARAARTQFEDEFDDALVTCEPEALFDRARGKPHADINLAEAPGVRRGTTLTTRGMR
jgi:hypothetical protein